MSERRRRWPWAVGGVALAIVIAVAVFAEPVTRWHITANVQTQVRDAIGLPDDHPVDVEFSGNALTALITREIPGMSVGAADVPLGEISGDVRVELSQVSLSGEAESIFGTVWITPETLRELLLDRVRAVVDDTDALGDAVTLEVDEPHLVVGTSVTIFGLTMPLDLALNVRAALEPQGAVFVSPAELRLEGRTLTAADIVSTFGGALAEVFDGWPICVADRIPRGLTITGIGMVDGRVEIMLSADGDLLIDPSLLEPGAC